MGAILRVAPPEMARGGKFGAIALRRRYYIIPHPKIYLLPEFEANWPKNNRVIKWAPF